MRCRHGVAIAWAGVLAAACAWVGPVAAQPAPGQVASLRVLRGDREVALPTDRRWLRLEAGDRELSIVMRRVPAAPGAGGERYRFRLDGVDRDWVVTGWPAEQRYARLAPGAHRLQVAVATGTGWSPAEERVLLVDSPWWQTRAVIAIGSAAALALLVWVVVVARVRRRRQVAWQLAQARRELAEKHSEAKTRFLATLGHEIRTPLTGVLGMAELLQGGSLEPRQRVQVEAIQNAGRHLLRLVNDALDLARIEAGRLALEPAPFVLRPLLDEVAALLRPLAEAKGLGFSLRCGDGLPPALLGDATRLRQILFNLGHNAVKFCDRGAVVVQVDPLPSTGIRLCVLDSGPGLDAECRSRLFRRFEPGADTSGSAGGSGLGLAICRELAMAMGGRIELDSAPGPGACFRVDLPLPAAVPLAVPAPVAGGAAGRSRRVLLVEDDPLVAEVVAGLLRRAGHEVVHAAHGLAALAEFDTGRFDVAVLDLDLPGIDGLALARLVRARWPIPLLALTARADPEAEPAARAAGMVGFLRKPVTGETLAATLEAVLA